MSKVRAPLNPSLELRGDLGYDAIAMAELAIVIEDAFGIDLDLGDLAGCRTIQDLDSLIAARSD